MKLFTKRTCALVLILAAVLGLAAPVSVNAAATTTYNIGYNLSQAKESVINDEYIAFLKEQYDAGNSNWCLQQYYKNDVNSSAKYVRVSAKMFTYKGDYFVFRIQSPGAGLRSLTLTHGTFFRDGVGTVYVLPVNTQDIGAALTPDNRVGKVDFYNGNTTAKTDVQWDQNTVVGSWNFGNDAEYLVVLQCSEAAPTSPKMGYMHIQSLTITEGELAPTTPLREANSMVVSDKAITTFEAATYAATGMINGQPHIYIPTEGKKVFVYNLETGEKYDEFETRFTVCRGITADDSGRIWLVGSQYYLQCYDPATKTLTEYTGFKTDANAANSAHDLIYANGCLYFGSSSRAHVFEFNIGTEQFRDLGNHNPDASYSCGIAYDPDGYIYAGLTGNMNGDDIHTREVVKIRLSDGACVGRTDVSDCVDKKEIMIRGAALCGDIYIAGGIEMNKMLAINTNTMTQQTLYCNGTAITNPISVSPTESFNGKHYFTLASKAYNGTVGSVSNGLYSIDDATGEVSFISNKFSNGLKLTQDSIISVNGVDCIFWMGGSYFRYMPLTGGDIVVLDKLVGSDDGASVTMDSIALGAPGSGEIYLGAFNNDKCAAFNTNTGKVEYNFYTNGQTDCMITYNGQLYAGNYKDGILVQVDRDDFTNNKVLIDFRYGKDQNGEPGNQVRVHALAAGDGKVFAGTMPDSYLRGGCIGWYDTVTGESYVERNVVENQSINSLSYHNGYLYGTTTTDGGTGAGVDTSLSAKLFVYDVANKRKVAEVDLRNEISGLPERLKHVGGIVADPNVAQNGKFWGVVSETLFSFTFNENTKTYNVKEEMVITKTGYAGPGATGIDICFLDGYIYVYFISSRLFCKINYSNPSQYSYLPIKDPKHYVIGEDKNLYYINDSTLYMYPLNITSADKTAADAVDAAILALPETITVAHKTQIEELQAAYDALLWGQKALTHYGYLLEEAQCKLLDARLAELDLNRLDQAQVNELLNIYNNMTLTQRSYVKNADILRQAQELLQRDVCAVGDDIYDTLEEAMAAAPAGAVIRLLKDAEEGEVNLVNGVTLDLNGHTLLCEVIDGTAIGNGYVIDSGAGRGILKVSDLMLLREDNTHMPLWDSVDGGYRFFAYTLEVDYAPEEATNGVVTFWYYMHFEEAAAYTLITREDTDLEIGVDLWWNDEFLTKVSFGAGDPLSTDAFSAQWAEAAADNDKIWLHAKISGLNDFNLEGTAKIVPYINANGVEAQPQSGNGAITYECKPFAPGFAERT